MLLFLLRSCPKCYSDKMKHLEERGAMSASCGVGEVLQNPPSIIFALSVSLCVCPGRTGDNEQTQDSHTHHLTGAHVAI